MVRTSSLHKQFKDPKRGAIHALDGVSIEAHPGQVTGVLGVNGAGKTTLLRILSTVLKPTSGSASVAGYDVIEDPAKVRASIGFMSSSTALYGRLTPIEVLRYFGGLYGLSGAGLEDRIAFAVERLNIAEFRDRLCDKLSTGQKQRVSIARTILHNPRVLFFDEPTTGLDVVTSQSVMEFIEEARTLGKTIVYCTHIMSEVERLCDNVYVVHDGRIRGEGKVEHLLALSGQATLEKAFLTLVGAESEGAAQGQAERIGTRA